MRIPDYRNVHGVKDLNHWTTKTSRVEKAHEDAFEKELEDSIHKRKSEEKTKIKKETQKKHQALIDESQELEEGYTREVADEDIAGTGFGFTLNIPKKENKYPGFSFAVAYAVLMFGSLRSLNASPDNTWGMVYLSGMTNY